MFHTFGGMMVNARQVPFQSINLERWNHQTTRTSVLFKVLVDDGACAEATELWRASINPVGDRSASLADGAMMKATWMSSNDSVNSPRENIILFLNQKPFGRMFSDNDK